MTPFTRRVQVFVATSSLLAVVSCTRTPPVLQPVPGAEQSVIDRLSFGRGMPNGGTVSDSAWRTFLDEVVMPRFPGGFGIMTGEGMWRYADGKSQREDSFHLEFYGSPGSAPDSTFEAIAREYIKRFHQEAVARTRFPVQSLMYWGVRPH